MKWIRESLQAFPLMIFQKSGPHIGLEHLARIDFLPSYEDFIAFPSKCHCTGHREELGDALQEPPGTGSWAEAVVAGPANAGGQLCLQ